MAEPIRTGSDSRVTRQFARETKFLVTPTVGQRIRDWARERLDPDPHGAGAARDEYTVTSLYFDTDEFDVYNQRGSFKRGKYRARRYGSLDVLFLERKLRTSSLLSKRRTIVALDHLQALDANPLVDGPGRWFHKRLIIRALQPSCQIAYRRIARQIDSPHGIMRLTLDDQLSAQRAAGLGLTAAPGMPFLERGQILELKYRIELPSVFKALVEEFALSPQSISKYRLAMDSLRGRRLTTDDGQGAPLELVGA